MAQSENLITTLQLSNRKKLARRYTRQLRQRWRQVVAIAHPDCVWRRCDPKACDHCEKGRPCALERRLWDAAWKSCISEGMAPTSAQLRACLEVKLLKREAAGMDSSDLMLRILKISLDHETDRTKLAIETAKMRLQADRRRRPYAEMVKELVIPSAPRSAESNGEATKEAPTKGLPEVVVVDTRGPE
jgi:hypothetical protein